MLKSARIYRRASTALKGISYYNTKSSGDMNVECNISKTTKADSKDQNPSPVARGVDIHTSSVGLPL